MGLLFLMTGLLCVVLFFVVQISRENSVEQEKVDATEPERQLDVLGHHYNNKAQLARDINAETYWQKWIPDRYSMQSVLVSLGLLKGKKLPFSP